MLNAHAGLSLKKGQQIHRKQSSVRKFIIKTEKKISSLYALAEDFFQHNCANAIHACMRETIDGAKYCRVFKYNPGHE